MINVGFDDDTAVEQPDIHNPTGPPAFMQLGPVTRPPAALAVVLGGTTWRSRSELNPWGPSARISFYLPRYLPRLTTLSLFPSSRRLLFTCTCRIVGLAQSRHLH